MAKSKKKSAPDSFIILDKIDTLEHGQNLLEFAHKHATFGCQSIQVNGKMQITFWRAGQMQLVADELNETFGSTKLFKITSSARNRKQRASSGDG